MKKLCSILGAIIFLKYLGRLTDIVIGNNFTTKLHDLVDWVLNAGHT